MKIITKTISKTLIFTLKPQELDKVQTDYVRSPTSNFKFVLNWFIQFIQCSGSQNSLCPFFKNHLQTHAPQNLLSWSLIINFVGYHWYHTGEPGSLGLHSVQVRCWT